MNVSVETHARENGSKLLSMMVLPFFILCTPFVATDDGRPFPKSGLSVEAFAMVADSPPYPHI